MLWVSGNIVSATTGIVGLSDFSLLGIPGTGHVQLLEQFGANPATLAGDLPYIRSLGATLAAAESPTSPTSFMTPEWLTLPLLNYPSSCGTPGGEICNTTTSQRLHASADTATSTASLLHGMAAVSQRTHVAPQQGRFPRPPRLL